MGIHPWTRPSGTRTSTHPSMPNSAHIASAPARIPRTAERKTVSPASVRPRPAPMHRGKSAYSGSSGTPWSREISSSSPSERPRDSRPSTRPWSTSRACTVRNGPSGYAAQADTGDEHLADGLLSGLQYLALHTRDRAAASGNALLRATVQPVTAECPPSSCTTVTTTPPSLRGSGPHRGRVGFTVSNVDELAAGGPELEAAARRLGSGLAQAFGRADDPAVLPGGGTASALLVPRVAHFTA